MTVETMTPPAPLVAPHGTLRARPGASTRSLPVRPGGPFIRSSVASPLRAFVAPNAPATPIAFRSARLDAGRLHAPDAVAAAGLAVLGELEVRLAGANRLRLRQHPVDDRAVRATSRAHVDATGRIVLPSGLRRHLGVERDGAVVVWAEVGATGEASGVLVIAHPAILVAAVEALERAAREVTATSQSAGTR